MASTPFEATSEPLRNEGEPAENYGMGKTRLSMAFSEVTGSFDGTTVAKTRSGLATRAKPTYRYPRIAAVQAGNARLRAANAAWNAMSVEQAEGWNRHAEDLPLRTGYDGTRYRTTGKNTLVAYASKLLQIDPDAAIPLDPPTGRFERPRARMEIEPTADGLRFVLSSALPEGVLVEIMVQPLINGKRKPTRFYKSAAFAAFPEAGSPFDIPLRAGWYACAWQFVEASTGRVAGYRTTGKVEVV